MPRGLLIVFSQPVSADREAEYNDWYDHVHLQEIVGVDGFVSAARYKAAAAQLGGQPPEGPPYVAVYEVEADDLASAMDALRSGMGSGAFRLSDAIDGATTRAIFVEQITAPVTAATPAGARATG